MIQKAYLQQKSNGSLGIEESLVLAELKRRNIECEYITKKKINRRILPISAETLVVGDVDIMYGTLKQLGVELPEADSYPSSLTNILYRRCSRGSVRDLELTLSEGLHGPVFCKPAKTQKRFTGRLFESEQDLYFLGDVSRRLDVWLCEPVKFVSEYRVYVVHSSIKAIEHYDGDPSISVSNNTITAAIQALDQSRQSYAGYAIDFGVLSTGETALVEMNDGFAIGAYNNISPKDYTDMLVARWNELTQNI